jgi:hypothetical protein
LCVQRCNAREDHPTIKAGEGEKVVACQAKGREEPFLDEGYDALVVIREGDATPYIDLIQKLAMPLAI